MALNRRLRPDPSTADRLVAGRISADDAPPGYRRTARLLGDAGSGFSGSISESEAATVGAMVAAIHGAPAPQVASRRSSLLSKILAAKTIAAVFFVALTATAGAAGTGNLPAGVQDRVANAAKAVGLNLPHGVERVSGEPCKVNGTEMTFRNRGQFLKQVRKEHPEALAAAKESRCGMPVNSDGTPGADESSEAPEAQATPGNNGKAGEHGKADKADKPDQAGDEQQGSAGDDPGPAGDSPGPAGDDPVPPAVIPPVETPDPGGLDAGGATGDEANDNAGENPDPAADLGSGNADDAPAAPAPDGS